MSRDFWQNINKFRITKYSSLNQNLPSHTINLEVKSLILLEFGRIIRAQRLRLKLSIEQAAECCEMSSRSLDDIELGKTNLRFMTVCQIIRGLEMDFVRFDVLLETKTDKSSWSANHNLLLKEPLDDYEIIEWFLLLFIHGFHTFISYSVLGRNISALRMHQFVKNKSNFR